MPLSYQINFWRSFKMQLIDWIVELKFKWKNHCVLSANGNDNDNTNSNNIIVTTKDIKLYVSVVKTS